jgi:acetyltransferase
MSARDQQLPRLQLALTPEKSVRASCARATDTLVLPDGTRLRLGPIGDDHRDRLAALFGRLSPKSRRLRYLGPKRELTPRELARLTDIDHVCNEAIVAIDERDGSIVGVARYAQIADRAGVAEVAAEVADDMQSLGIGTELARRTLDRARANGLTLLTATTLWENRPARALLRGLGFRTRASHGSEIELELELSPDGEAGHRERRSVHTEAGAMS